MTHQPTSDPSSSDRLFGRAYDELRDLAARYLGREHAQPTLQATELVNEAYVRLAPASGLEVEGRTHFFALAARAMRRVLVDHARARGAKKRSGGLQRVTLAEGLRGGTEVDFEALLELDQAIARLARLDERQAKVVELRFFSGLDMAEIAEELDVSKRTVEGDWAHARAWLRRELSGAAGAE